MSTSLPTIGIDCRFAATHSGIGTYTRELLRHLLDRDDPWTYVFFTVIHERTGLEDILPHPRAISCQLSADPYSLAEQLQLPAILRNLSPALYHCPHFNIPLRCPVPFIATIHDLILHAYPNQATLERRIAYRILMRHTIRSARRIIAVSAFTAHEIKEHYGEEAMRKTVVIPEGVAAHFTPASPVEIQRVRRTYELPERFVLYVGASKEHKNVQSLIDGCPESLPLVLVTDGREVDHLCLRGNIRILRSVPDRDLPALYSSAHAFVSPSFTEGFNLPILEAMACGCPVIATRCGSTPEVAHGFALLIDPTKEEILRTLSKPIVYDRNAAMQYARGFSWAGMAQRTAEVYDDFLHGSNR